MKCPAAPSAPPERWQMYGPWIRESISGRTNRILAGRPRLAAASRTASSEQPRCGSVGNRAFTSLSEASRLKSRIITNSAVGPQSPFSRHFGSQRMLAGTIAGSRAGGVSGADLSGSASVMPSACRGRGAPTYHRSAKQQQLQLHRRIAHPRRKSTAPTISYNKQQTRNY